MMLPATNRSGYAASITATYAAPAENPVMYTCDVSIELDVASWSIIWTIDSASPDPRVWSAGPKKSKHSSVLFADCCCGYSTAKPVASASASQPADCIDDAVIVQP